MHNHVMSWLTGMIFAGPRHGSAHHRILPAGCARLFGGVCFADRRMALLGPLAAMFSATWYWA